MYSVLKYLFNVVGLTLIAIGFSIPFKYYGVLLFIGGTLYTISIAIDVDDIDNLKKDMKTLKSSINEKDKKQENLVHRETAEPFKWFKIPEEWPTDMREVLLAYKNYPMSNEMQYEVGWYDTRIKKWRGSIFKDGLARSEDVIAWANIPKVK